MTSSGVTVVLYTWKNTWSVTAFNSTNIRSVEYNVVTPVTAMMVTVCISTDALSPVFISLFLYRLQQSVLNIPVSFCYIRLIQPRLTSKQSIHAVLSHVNFYGMNLLTVFVIIDFSTVGDVCANVTWFDGCHKPRFLEEIRDFGF